MSTTYVIKNYRNSKEDKTVTVRGEVERAVLGYKDNQEEVGIKIICPKCKRDYFENETILLNGHLGCICEVNK